MQGNLKDMAAADLIQHNCMDGKTARLTIKNQEQEALIYFDAGDVVHAVLGEAEGEEVVYRILSWDEGTFVLDGGEEAPARTINRSCAGLLLEGARRLDEGTLDERQRCEQCGTFLDRHGNCKNPRCPEFVANSEALNGLDDLNQDSNVEKENVTMAKTRGERLADALSELLADSSDIQGAAIVGYDGLVYSANVPQKALDEEMVGAVSASIFGLSNRSAEQLERGDLSRALIQGSDGNIIVAAINDETLIVGLTESDVNLGMAFMEIRSMTKTLAEIL